MNGDGIQCKEQQGKKTEVVISLESPYPNSSDPAGKPKKYDNDTDAIQRPYLWKKLSSLYMISQWPQHNNGNKG